MSVDVLIFTNSHGEKLNNAISSVLKQNIKLKIHIFNNGKKLSINKNLKKEIFAIHEVQHINGPSVLRNYGIDNSNSEYVFFLDGDDEWVENKLKYQLAILNKYENDIVFSNCYNFNILTKELSISDNKFYNKNQFENMILRNFSITGSMSGIGLKRKVLEDTKDTYGYIFNKNISYGEDFDLYLRLSMKHKFRKIFKGLVIINQYPKSYSKKFSILSIYYWRFKVKLKNTLMNRKNLSFSSNIILLIFIFSELAAQIIFCLRYLKPFSPKR